MKKVKKVVALSIGLLMASSLFAGCTTDGLSLLNGLEKSGTVTSEQTQTDLTLNVSGTNLSTKEHQSLDAALPLINESKVSVTTKINENQAKTIAKVQEDYDMQLGGTPVSTSIWANEDLTGATPAIYEVIKVPQIVSTQLPTQFQGKDYAIINSDELNAEPGASKIDYKKLLTFSQDFEPKLLAFIGKYAAQFNPTGSYINRVGGESYFENGVSVQSNTYELKLTDQSFKDLVHYTLTNLASNADAISLVKDYVSGIASVYGITDTTKLNSITNNLPTELATLNTKLSSLDKLKILGDNGISIRYTVNNDGYISNEKGNAQFVVDLPSIIKLASTSVAGTTTANNPTGIYTINLGFNTNITNINAAVPVVLPTINSTNSFNYVDLIKSMTTTKKSSVKQSIINQLIINK